jgi:alanine dehydrogenase
VSVRAGQLGPEEVAQLGDVQTGEEKGRQSKHGITVFDSTGLAVQNLAVALAVYDRRRANPDMEHFVGVSEIEL